MQKRRYMMTMTHKHHRIPRHMGGTDDIENIIELTVEEHAFAHLELYEQYGKKEDLTAFYLLSGHLKEGFEERAKLGGARQGRLNAETGHIQKISKAQTREERSVNGKKGSSVCRSKSVNSFFDPMLRANIASKGGSVQGKRNAESGHLTNISREYWQAVKDGKIDRIKRCWYYSDEKKISIQIREGDPVPEGFQKGRKIKFR